MAADAHLANARCQFYRNGIPGLQRVMFMTLSILYGSMKRICRRRPGAAEIQRGSGISGSGGAAGADMKGRYEDRAQFVWKRS